MAKFLTKAGLLIETNDKDKIECYKAKGLTEITEEPKPIQAVEVADDFVVKPAKKKKVTKKGA
jgi:hypothetical protein